MQFPFVQAFTKDSSLDLMLCTSKISIFMLPRPHERFSLILINPSTSEIQTRHYTLFLHVHFTWMVICHSKTQILQLLPSLVNLLVLFMFLASRPRIHHFRIWVDNYAQTSQTTHQFTVDASSIHLF